jgi:hypothetical protein
MGMVAPLSCGVGRWGVVGSVRRRGGRRLWASMLIRNAVGAKLVADEPVSHAPSHDSCCIESKRRAAVGTSSVRYFARASGHGFLQTRSKYKAYLYP